MLYLQKFYYGRQTVNVDKVSTMKYSFRATQEEENFLEQLKTKYSFNTDTEAIHKSFDMLFSFLEKEKPKQARASHLKT